MSVHILAYGLARCALPGPPRDWPEGEQWVSADDKKHLPEVDCWRCVCVHLGKPVPTPPPMPEHDKVTASGDLPQKLCEFVLEFLAGSGFVLGQRHEHQDDCYAGEGQERVKICDMRKGELYATNRNIVDLAAEFIGVDPKKYSLEKDDALKHIRALHALEDWAKREGRAMLAKAT